METVIGIDDTDAPSEGMCTTYLGAVIAGDLEAAGHAVGARLLIRLNPAAPHKTRGNAAVAIHTDAPLEAAFTTARRHTDALALQEAPETQPGVVALDRSEAPSLAPFTWRCVRTLVDADAALAALADLEARRWSPAGPRGAIGATAAVGARWAVPTWSTEVIGYRPRERWGTDRRVDADSAFAASRATYPRTWDTVDVTAGAVVCVPHTPGPVLYGLRGEDAAAVTAAAGILEHEPLERRAMFATNQGSDMHLRPGTPGSVRDGRAYRVTGRVRAAPETRPGGHVHLSVGAADGTLPCVAFEPTKRFRDRVRALGVGDGVTACGEVADGTLKLEKFALRSSRRYERVVPRCPSCGRRMDSAGAGQGYRCRDCGHDRPGRVPVPRSSKLEPGWYEVPPVARRHLARPLVRGGFDAPVHPAH